MALMIAEVIYFAENSLKLAHIHIIISFGLGKSAILRGSSYFCYLKME
ncbi:hypothetical protein lpp2957 [Legionella pneumophila str. Paris]|nr:hypothetical protein lpp2957 [Legionella pneumophila str. Paris]